MFFAVGFETTAPANAMAAYQARREGLGNFSMLVSHVLVPPAMRAILEAPGNRIQGFLAAGHVCTIMGCGRVRAARGALPRAHRGHRLRADRHSGGRLLVRAPARGRAGRGREPVQPFRARDGNAAARAMMAEVFRVIPRRWRGIGDIAESGLGPGRGLRRVRRGAPLRPRRAAARRTSASASAASCCAASASRRVPRLRDALHARASARRHHGVVGGRLRRLLPLSRRDAATRHERRRRHRARLSRSGRDDRGRDPARPWRRRTRDGAPARRRHPPRLRRRRAGAPPRRRGARSRRARRPSPPIPTSCGRCSFPAATSAPWRSTARSTTSPCAAPARCYLSVGLILEEGLPLATLRRVVASMRGAAAAAGVRLVTGDTKVVERGKADGMFVNTAGLGRVVAPAPIGPARRAARRRGDPQRRHRPPRHGGDGGARGLRLRDRRSRATARPSPRRCWR